MMHKRTALLLVIALVVSLVAPANGAWIPVAQAAPAKYLHLDFDAYSAEPSVATPASTAGGGGNWSFFNTTAGVDYAFGEQFPDKEGRSFTIVSNTGNRHTNIQKSNLTIPGAGLTPTVVMEGRFRFSTTTHERSLFFANLTKLPDTAVLGNITVVADAEGGLSFRYPGSGGIQTAVLGAYEADSWYHIQVYIDLSNYQLQLYINGEHRLSNLDVSTNWDNLRHFRFTQVGKEEEEGRLTIDDVKVYDFIALASVGLDHSEISLLPGEQRQLNATVVPSDSTNPYLIWASDNSNAATVDNEGNVTAIADGTATITATSRENNAIKASATVTVAAYAAVESVDVIPATVQVETERTVALNALVLPANATNKAVSWFSDNEAVALVDQNGMVSGLAAGTATIVATSVDGGKTGESVVTVVPRSTTVESIAIPASANVAIGDQITITPRFQPGDATDQSVQWMSDNTDIAQVDSSGTIVGRSLGSTIITVAANGGNGTVTASTAITVVPASIAGDEFDEMRLRWKGVLDGGPTLNLDNVNIASQVVDLNVKAAALWQTMIVGETRNALWPDMLPSTTDSRFINEYFTRLRNMAYAYSTKGGELYHNISMLEDMKSALDWIYDNAYNESVTQYGNWWNFNIGAPLRVMDIMVMLHDELSAEEIDRFVRTADKFIGDIMDPSFISSGANRSDILTAVTIMGILTKDADRLEDVLVQLSPLFVYVEDGDGFYEDGSYIQHNTIPYTGSYGEVLIRGIGNLFYLLNDTTWEVRDPDAVNVYRWIYEAVAPVIYRGETMDMVRGRAIAREFLSGYEATTGIMSGIIRLAMAAPEEDSLHFKQMIKHWTLAMGSSIDVYVSLRMDLVEPLEDIVNDASIVPVGDLPAHYEFGGMNRTVHYGEEFAFGISKSSRRVATYELTNGENGEGWYTGDGMTYLYTADSTQFTDDFWPTVNRYRLPGTTVDTRPRTNDHYQYGDGETTPGNTWAGGVTLGRDGVSGMNLQQVGTTLKANKSWFMFDDMIVALGSGITSTDGRAIETIVEQRKLNGNGDNALIVNGVAQPTTLGWNDDLQDVSWIHLAGNTAGADIGYYFPEGQSLKANRRENSGTWYAINKNDSISTDLRTRNYASFWFDHGANPVDETYSYVLLPNRTPAETEQFGQTPTIAIIENSVDAHAVRDLVSNQIGINYWKDGLTTTAGVTSNRQASLLMKENNDQTLEVAVSDPTFMNTGAIEIEIDQSAAAVVSADDSVFVTQLHPTIKFKVSTKDSLSRSFTVKFDMDPVKPRPDADAETPLPANTKEALSTEVPITHLYSTFDSEKLGNQPVNWIIENSANTIATVEALSDGEDRMLRFIDRNPTGASTATSLFEPQSGFLKVAWKFNDLYGGSGTSFKLMNGDTAAIEIISRDGGLYRLDNNSAERLVAEIEPAHWYAMELHVDAAGGQWDLLIDGELVLLNVMFIEPISGIDSIQIATGDVETDSVVYVDDVAVYVTGAVTLLADEFETYEAGGQPGEWIIVQNPVNAPVYVVYDDEERNKSVLMDDQNTSFRSTMKHSFQPQSGRLIAEWRYKEMGGGKYPEFLLQSNTTDVIRLSSSSNNNLRFYGPGAASNSIAQSARTKIDTWHTVKMDIDIEAGVYDIYFDGTLAESGLGFYKPGDYIDGISFGSAYSAPDAPLYIDSVKVYSYDATAPLWETGTEMSVSDITASGLKLTWTHAADNSEIGAYKLYLDGVPLQTISGNTASYIVEGLEAETEYSFMLHAVDTSGHYTVEPLLATAATLAAENEDNEEQPGNGNGGSNNPESSTGSQGSSSEPGDKQEEIIITSGKWKELVSSHKNGIVPIASGNITFMLPIELLDMEQLANELNTSSEELNVHVTIGKAKGTTAAQFEEAVQSSGVALVSDIVQFGLTVHAAGAEKRFDSFGHRYVERTIVLDSPASLSALAVVQLDPGTGELIFVPARFESVNGITTAFITSVNNGLFAVVQFSRTFQDTNGHWAQAEIEQLASRLLIKGLSKARFEPDAAITRAEFIALLVRSLGLLEQAGGAVFTDVSNEAWYYGGLNAASEAGLVQGYADNTFRPDAPVSREEMAVFIQRALQFVGHTQESMYNPDALSPFEDMVQVQPWAVASVSLLVDAGIINGMTNKTFVPQGNLTRAQTAVILKRMLEYQK